ncbi:MAG: DUF4111 domain-containing protein [Chloroflexi bacterium]|nr:DUF4111 domain-containing protein [Chloroflexota bacterium]
MDRLGSPSPDLLDSLTAAMCSVLGDDLVGLYLYGSAVTGGFDVGVSDLDLAAVTGPEVEMLDLVALERMHRNFEERNPEWSGRIEVVYIGRATLASFRTSPGTVAVISPGEPFHVRDDRVADWLQNWYLVRTTARTLWGTPADDVVPIVAWREFVDAAVRYADEVGKRSRANIGGGTLAYTILTLCRALRVVRTQTPGSKQDGAAWARERFPDWAWLIDASLACRLSGGKAGLDDESSRAAAETFIAQVVGEISGGGAVEAVR